MAWPKKCNDTRSKHRAYSIVKGENLLCDRVKLYGGVATPDTKAAIMTTFADPGIHKNHYDRTFIHEMVPYQVLPVIFSNI
jgi:hypothetical protein